ncbi:MAG TPA: glycine oxidase ThiO [Candidatus Cybelea sp.]|nr:glycine oxidase ThiO [Candidatus Cybelea sp.]
MNGVSGDVAICGGGLIGLSLAFELAERGATVRVFERGEPGRAASWAGAGLLAPYSESLHGDAMLALGTASLEEYPAFVRRVEDAGGVDVRLHLDGVVRAAFAPEQCKALGAQQRDLHARGVPSELLDRSQVLAAEPWIGHDVSEALLVHDEGWIDNRRLGRALVAASQARGVSISQTSSLRVECDTRRVLGVATDDGFIAAGAVVNACGAWAAQLPGVPASCVAPVEPVKGQMLALSVPPHFVQRAAWLAGIYLVPRDDPRLLVGATVESAGFDERVTAHGIDALLHAALTAAPSLGAFSVTETWAGLRPGSPDGLPFLGSTPIAGYFLATGHYRNGILLTPVTARLVADAVEGKADEALTAFSLSRLGTEERAPRRTLSA